MARPQIDIDPVKVEELALDGCTNEEIADYFDCSTDTIERRFAGELRKGRVRLKRSLRQVQIETAKTGNPTMLIWLGKQMLGQEDKSRIEIGKIPDEILIEEVKKRLANGSEQPRDIAEIRLIKNETDKDVPP